MKLPKVDKSRIERFSNPPSIKINLEIVGGFIFGILFWNAVYIIFLR